MIAAKSLPERRRPLRLPDIDDRRIPGWRLTRRAVGLSLMICGVLALAGVIVATIVAIDVTIDANGVLEPADVWQVRSVEAGTLSSVLVRQGDRVNAGQPIARLDSLANWTARSELAAQIRSTRIDIERLLQSAPLEADRMRASVDAARARVSRARTSIRDRMANFGLPPGDPDSVANASATRLHLGLDAAAADLFAAKADLAAAESQLATAALSTFDIERKRAELTRLETLLAASRVRLARAILTSPVAGVVLTDQPERLVGSATASGQTVIELGDTRRWAAVAAVSERDVHRVRVGDQAVVEVPALATTSTDRVPGRVSTIGLQSAASTTAPGFASASSGSINAYRMVVDLDSTSASALGTEVLRRGYSVRVRVITRRGTILSLARDHVREQLRRFTR